MRAGDRVRYNDGEMFPSLGTVLKVSPVGYVRVEWDKSVLWTQSSFSPWAAEQGLTVVIGEDARPRHDWDTRPGVDPVKAGPLDYICTTCGAHATETNDYEPCEAAR